jgi:site-specific DNA-cytosine methylase
MHGCFPRFQDKHFGDRVTVVCDVIPPFHEVDSKVLLWNVADGIDYLRPDKPDWIYDADSIYIPIQEQGLDAFHCLETFAGGFGGWKYGISFLMKEHGIRCQTVSIESNLQAAQDYCMMHDAVLIEAMNCSPKVDLSCIDRDIVLHADVESQSWWECVSRWRVDLITVSSPCPPWTLASSGPGLANDQGCLLPYSLLLNRILRPKLCLVEQVNGFSTHAHKQFCLATMKAVCFHLKWARVVDSSEWGCAKRLRWIAIMIRNHAIGVSEIGCSTWPKIDQLTPAKIGALFGRDVPQLDSLIPSQLMISCAKDATLLPPNMKQKLWNASGDEILRSRCHDANEVAPTIMAKYGQQHLIARHNMEGKGYFGSFVIDQEQRIRLMHPIEVGLVHLIHSKIFVSKDLHQAWTHLGNQITFPHATLTLANALNQLEIMHPKIDIHDLFMNMHGKILKTDEMSIYQGKHGIVGANSDWSREIWMHRLKNYDELCEGSHQFWLPENHVWSPDDGLMHIDTFMAEDDWSRISENATMSPVSEGTECEEMHISPTMPINPLIKVKAVMGTKNFSFWIDHEVSVVDIERHFGRRFEVQHLPPQPDGCSMLITTTEDIMFDDENDGKHVVPCFHEGNVILCCFNNTDELKDQLQRKGMSKLGFDQYGEIVDGQKIHEGWLIADFQLSHRPLTIDAAFILAAFQGTQMAFKFDAEKFEYVIEIHGPPASRQILSDFWASVCTSECQRKLTLNIQVEASEHSSKIVYKAIAGQFVMPPQTFAECLSVLASRRVLDAMQAERGIDTTIKWFCKPLWIGKIDPMTNMLVISSLLQITQWPSLMGKEIRLVAMGKQCCNISVAELTKNMSGSLTIHAVLQMTGGAGTKEAIKIHTRNSIAATLLELGYQFEWVSKTTETLVDNAGKKATVVAQMPPGKQRSDAIISLCQDCAIVIPDKLTKDAIQASKTDHAQKKKDR